METNKSENYAESFEDDDELERESEDSMNSDIIESPPPSAPPQSSKKRKKVDDHLERAFVAHLEKKEEKTEDDLFGQTIAASLKR